MKPLLPALRSRPRPRRAGVGKAARRMRAVATLAAVSIAAIGVVALASTSAQAADTNLSQGKTATSSSNESTGSTPNFAVDGNPGTRWSSAFSDPQWLEVDLGSTATIDSVTLNWEAAYGKAFEIQTSADGNSWTDIYSTTTGTGGVQNLTVSGSGRYVRMYGTARGTGYGYSLWEFQVFGSFTGATAPPSTWVPNLDPGESITVNPPVVGQGAGPELRLPAGHLPLRVPGQLLGDPEPAGRPDRVPGPAGCFAHAHLHGQHRPPRRPAPTVSSWPAARPVSLRRTGPVTGSRRSTTGPRRSCRPAPR